jgi:hypothetical protein
MPNNVTMQGKLWNAGEAAGTTTCNMPDVLQQTKNSWQNRVQLCIDCNGELLVTG